MTALSDTLRRAYRRLTGRGAVASVAEEWEWYARDFRRGTVPSRAYLGEDWNDPATIGAGVAADDFVEHVIERVVLPHLGTPASLLEIGCGAGRFTVPLAARVPRILAADTSPAMLQLLAERLPNGAAVELVRLDGRGLGGIADGAVESAFSYDVFVHLAHHDTFRYLTELKRVLVPGGRAVIHHGNTFSELGWRKFENDQQRRRRGQPSRGEFVVMTPELMRELATRAGLLVTGCVTDVAARDAISLLVAPGDGR